MASTPPRDMKASSAAAQKIRELNAINEKVPEILKSARVAIEALSASPQETSSLPQNDVASLNRNQEAFTAATRNYFSLVLSVKEELEAQAKALEDAGIIASKSEEEGDGRHMSLGALDVGWLNERRGDVGRGFEGELVAQARNVVKKLLKENNEDSDHKMGGA